ncbi:MAG: serine/threonine protein kinase, partial [Gammaproteobacteria bacterium]|nr:serine/threonine protein kinase [Gammaproteobacteria bacterium]
VSGKKIDGRSDIFSIGVTLYQLLTGKVPFTGQPLATLMYQIANDKHEDVRSIRPDFPVCVSAIVNKALQKDPDQRYQSGKDMANAMRMCMKQLYY